MRWRARLCQGYLVVGEDGLVLRVRTSLPLPPLSVAAGCAEAAATEASIPDREAEAPEGSAWLTLKAPPPAEPADGLVRLEYEFAIPLRDGEELLALTERRVRKHRHGLDLPGGDWVLDVFEGPNAPLVVAEVELARTDQPVPVPPWCLREITGRHELSNAALAIRPLGSWSEQERQALWQGDDPATWGSTGSGAGPASSRSS